MRNLSLGLLLLVATSAFSQATFTTIYNTLQTKCMSCHSGGTPAGGLNLSGTETQVYNAIFEVAPQNATAAAKGDKLIDAGYPERSFLLRKVAHGLSHDLELTAGEGNAEPNGQTKLNDQDIELIRQWVLMAAPKTGTVTNYQRLVDYYTTGGRPKIARPTPPPAGQGYQIHLGPVFWAPGEETEFFKKYDPRFPNAVDVNRFEVFMNQESHHFILRKFHPGGDANWSDGIEAFSFDAFSDDKDFVNAWQGSTDLELPVGTAFFWDENTILDLNYHMKNAHSEILPGEMYINVYTTPHSATAVEMKAELIPYVSLFIPGGGQTTTFSDAITRSGQTWNIWMLSTHTHKYGIDYDIFQRNGNGSQGTQLYEGHSNFEHTFNQGYYAWEHPPVKRFSPMVPVNMGNGLIHKAQYKNTGSQFVTWGFTTDGEMMLIYVQYTTQNVTYKPPLRVNGSTAGCDPVQLSTDAGLSGYIWSTGDTTQTITVSSPGTYNVTITASNGSTYTADPVVINVNAATVNLNDAAFCQNSGTTLDAGSAVSYLWSTGATTQTIVPNTSGSYGVTVTNSSGCTAADAANVTVHQLPLVNLSDISICTGSSATFDAGNAGATFAWSTGETTQTITVNQQGMYSVTVTGAGGCAGTDAAMLNTGTNLVFDIQDKNLCSGTNVSLDAGFPGSTYAWSNGATTQTINVSAGGSYTVTVTDQTGCNGSDNATVTEVQNPTANAGDDQKLCPNGTVNLTATGGVLYVWSSGQQGGTITVDAAADYNVTVTDANGCSASDLTKVEASVISTGFITGDENVASYSTITYNVNDNSGSSYVWAATNGTIVSGQGSNAVEVNWGSMGAAALEVTETNADGCTGTKVSLDVNVGGVGIKGIAAEEISIYPNPFNETARIVFPQELRDASLSIRDIAGRLVYFNPSVSGKVITISREGLSGGLYFAEIRGEKVFRGKMIVGE